MAQRVNGDVRAHSGGVVALQTAEAVVLGSNLAFLTVEKLRRQADSLCLL